MFQRGKSFSPNLLLAVLLLAVTGAAFAETDSRKPFLWKIEGLSPSYLFGTIHFADPRVTELPPAVEKALADSDAVYTEIPLDLRSQFEAANKFLLPGDQTLYDILPKPLLQRVDRYLQSIDPALTVAPLAKVKVWALGVTLPLLEQQLSHPNRQPLDLMLHTLAVQGGKDTGGLETIEEQTSVFDDLATDAQIQVLEDTLTYLEDLDARNLKIADVFIEEYLLGDIDGLGGLMMEYMEPDSALDKQLLEAMLFKRNRLMAARIDDLLEKNKSVSYFFAVGAAHYWTDEGVQELLRKRGYTVVRIR